MKTVDIIVLVASVVLAAATGYYALYVTRSINEYIAEAGEDPRCLDVGCPDPSPVVGVSGGHVTLNHCVDNAPSPNLVRAVHECALDHTSEEGEALRANGWAKDLEAFYKTYNTECNGIWGEFANTTGDEVEMYDFMGDLTLCAAK